MLCIDIGTEAEKEVTCLVESESPDFSPKFYLLLLCVLCHCRRAHATTGICVEVRAQSL